MPSMCPCTKCPPNSLPAVSGRSRFTRAPGFSSPNDVRRRVSPERSAAKRMLSLETTVRQQPFTAMLLETASDAATSGARIVKRPPSAGKSGDSILPICSMIPVNIVQISFDGEIGAEAMKLNVFEWRQDELPCSRERHPVLSRHFGSIEQKQFLHDACRERCAVQLAACFEQDAQDIALAQLFENTVQAHAAALARRLDDLHAGALELLCLDGFCRSQRENQKVIFR